MNLRSAATAADAPDLIDDPFRHEALFYSGDGEFIERTTAFIEGGLAGREPVLVIVVAPKIDLLRDALGATAEKVLWADMADIGRNPGRIISAWRDFVAEHSDGESQRVRGIGEPIWAARTMKELVESQRHESLINLAFAGVPAWVLCPYDLDSLDASVIDEAYRSHPFVTAGGVHGCSDTFRDLAEIARPFDDPLIQPDSAYEELLLTVDGLTQMRTLVRGRAASVGVASGRVSDFVLAVNEVATNSLRHGKGRAALRVWSEDGELICEVADEGAIEAPLVGRQRPPLGHDSGYGLWIANQLCDLVQLRSFPAGSVVRLHISLL